MEALVALVLVSMAGWSLLATLVAGTSLAWSASLHSRLEALERAIRRSGEAMPAELSSSELSSSERSPSEPGPDVAADAAEPTSPAEAAPPPPPSVVEQLRERLGALPLERLAVWIAAGLGGLLLLLASLLTLAVALDRGWLGPAARVCGGLTGGMALWWAAGSMRVRGYRWLGSATAGAGMGTLYGVLYAAASRYDLLPEWAAFGLMCAVTTVAIAGAVRHSDRAMAHLGLLGGLLTPILVSTGSNRPVALFGYLSLLATGAMVAAHRRRWADLVVTAGAGSLVLYLGWSGRWFQPDQLPFALGAALALSIPFAALAARARGAVGGVAIAVAATLPLAAAIWLPPVDPVSIDPRSGLALFRPLAAAGLWAAAGAVLLPLPLWGAVRARRSPPRVALAVVIALVVSVVHALGWSDVPNVASMPVVLAPVALAALGVLWSWRWTPAAAVLLVSAGLIVGGQTWAVGPAALFLTILGVLGSLGAAGEGHRSAWLMAALAGVVLALRDAPGLIAAGSVASVAGPAVLAYALVATLPLWRMAPGKTEGAWVAAVAGPALFWPLYQCWVASPGEPVVGALPALLGACALLGAALVVRVARADARDGTLALFVGVALLGLTAAVPLQIHEGWLTVAWALEAAALAWLCRRLHHRLVFWGAVALAGIVSVRLLANPWALSYGDAGGLPILNWTLYTWGVPALALLATARWLTPATGPHPLARAMPSALTVLGVLVGFALVEVEIAHFFADQGPVELGGTGLVHGMVRSVAWAIYGVGVLSGGLAAGRRGLRMLGFGFVLLGTAKFFAFDLWSMSGFARVGSALGLGISLLIAAFLFERLVLRRSK